MNLRPPAASLLCKHLRAKLCTRGNSIAISLVETRCNCISDATGSGRDISGTHSNRDLTGAMNCHRDEGSIGRRVRHTDEAEERMCVSGNRCIHVMRISCGEYDLRRADVGGSRVFPLLDHQLAITRRLDQLSRNPWSYDFDSCTRCAQRECLTRPHRTAANNEGGNLFAVQRNRQRRQRNCPLFSATTRNTT